MPLLDAMRAFASVVILLHHFAIYPPLCEHAKPVLGALGQWLHDYGRLTQVFFVVSGYVMACKMSTRSWCLPTVRLFLIRRYCRLGIPYLAAIILAIAACQFGRGWLPEDVIGTPPSVPQFVAHVFFLQELLGYEHFSAGVWFVCINFQLGLIHVILLWLRDGAPRWFASFAANRPDVPMIAGWGLSLVSLFYFNRNPCWDSCAIYFFPYFFMGLVIHKALRSKRSGAEFWIYLFVIALAMLMDWRWRPVTTIAVGLLLFSAVKCGFANRWPESSVIARMGRVSYSLFLVHFPILIMVATVWQRFGWTSPHAAVAGLLAAVIASVASSFAFHHYIERPATDLSRRWGYLEQTEAAYSTVIGAHAVAPSEPG